MCNGDAHERHVSDEHVAMHVEVPAGAVEVPTPIVPSSASTSTITVPRTLRPNDDRVARYSG